MSCTFLELIGHVQNLFFDFFSILNACQVRFVGVGESEAHLRIFVAELMGQRGDGGGVTAGRVH